MRRLPKLRTHPARNYCFIEIDGRRISMGAPGELMTQVNYHRAVAEWLEKKIPGYVSAAEQVYEPKAVPPATEVEVNETEVLDLRPKKDRPPVRKTSEDDLAILDRAMRAASPELYSEARRRAKWTPVKIGEESLRTAWRLYLYREGVRDVRTTGISMGDCIPDIRWERFGVGHIGECKIGTKQLRQARSGLVQCQIYQQRCPDEQVIGIGNEQWHEQTIELARLYPNIELRNARSVVIDYFAALRLCARNEETVLQFGESAILFDLVPWSTQIKSF